MFSLSCGGPVPAPKDHGTTTSWRPAESHRSVRRSPLCCDANDDAASIETTPPAHGHVRTITKVWRGCDSFLNNAIWTELPFFKTQPQTQTGVFLFALFQPGAPVTVTDGVQCDHGFIYRHHVFPFSCRLTSSCRRLPHVSNSDDLIQLQMVKKQDGMITHRATQKHTNTGICETH